MHNHVSVYINHLLIFQDFIILNLRNGAHGSRHVIAKEKGVIELPKIQRQQKIYRNVDCLSYSYREDKKLI